MSESTGRNVLPVDAVKVALGLSGQSWFDDLLLRIAGNAIGEVDLASFIDWIETGVMVTQMVASAAEPKKPPPRVLRSSNSLPSNGATDDATDDAVKPPPGPPVLVGFSPLQPSGSRIVSMDAGLGAAPRRFVKDSAAAPQAAMYPDVLNCLGFRPPTECRELWHHPGAVLNLTAKDSYRKAGPSRPLWRKRETVIHERIVCYTTVDPEGGEMLFCCSLTPSFFKSVRFIIPFVWTGVQELVETEKSQNEIIHLECKETGEFAHRESQLYEASGYTCRTHRAPSKCTSSFCSGRPLQCCSVRSGVPSQCLTPSRVSNVELPAGY